MFKTTLLIGILGLFNAWLPTGHFITALIAQIELQNEDLELFKKLENIINVLSPFTAEKNYKFIECAEFPDDIKYQNWKSFNSWHFYNHYFFNNVEPRDMPDDKENLVWAIVNALVNLNTNRPSKIDQMLGKSFNLRYLIHLIGDIHQPLHNVSMVSKEFPKGDSGGNKFKINMPGAYDLHKFWDLCLKQFKQVRSPLKETDFDYLLNITKYIMKENTRESLQEELKEKSYKKWSLKGFDLAQKIVYDGIQPNSEPSKTYIDRGFKIIKRQLALAGYRLTNVLKSLRLPDVNVKTMKE